MKVNKSSHTSLDLHGYSHDEAEVLIEEFIIRNIKDIPLEVITGNSVDMLAVLRKVVLKHALHLIPSHSSNMGSYLVTTPLYIK